MRRKLLTFLVLIVIIFIGCGDQKKNEATLKAEGQAALDSGDFMKAVNIFREALQKDHSNRDLLYLMGTSFKRLDLFDSAVTYFKRGQILYTKDRDFNKELKDLLPMFGDYSGAIQAIALLVETGDNERMYWHQLAELYYFNRELEMAVRYYKLLIDENPERASIYMELSHTLSELGKYDESIVVLHQSLNNIGQTPEAWANIGVNEISLKHFEQAEAAFRKSLALKNDNVAIWVNLANLLSTMDSRAKQKEALDIYKQFRDQIPAVYNPDSVITSLSEKLGVN